MIYKNTVTGATICTECEISGGDWVLDEPKPELTVLKEKALEKEAPAVPKIAPKIKSTRKKT